MSPPRRPRVLVVDDEDDVREVMAEVLSAEGYDVTTVADGASALRAAEARRFDVATLDLRMPGGLCGRVTLAALRRRAPGLAVVIVSGYVTPSEAEACLSLGAHGILHKPFTVEALLRLLREARKKLTFTSTSSSP